MNKHNLKIRIQKERKQFRNMDDVCRTCLTIVDSNSSPHYNIEINDDSETSCRYKILSVIPEIDLSISKNPIICNKCHENLEETFNFRMKCLQIEDMIMQYADSKPDLNIILDLKEVMVKVKQEENIKCEQENNCIHENIPVNVKHENEEVYIKEEIRSGDENDENSSSVQELNKNGPFECDACGRTFARKCSFTVHMNNHQVKSQTTVYTCQYCNKDFNKRFYYKAHLRIHTGEKCFECHICHKKFALRPTLRKHLTTHNEVRLYKCDFCDRSFKYVESLEAHRNIHTVERKFQCDVCKQSFYRKTTLRAHMMVHTKEKPFRCPICGKAFNRKTRTKEHIVNMHKEVDVNTVVVQSSSSQECILGDC